jgi:hypothetical protein
MPCNTENMFPWKKVKKTYIFGGFEKDYPHYGEIYCTTILNATYRKLQIV